jgi:hypothetical protein
MAVIRTPPFEHPKNMINSESNKAMEPTNGGRASS